MATFTFTCVEHGDLDHDSREAPVCFCGELMKRVYTVPYISAAARPTSRPEAAASIERERRWATDIPAYRRLRRNGVQPAGIDGSARLEARAETQTEIERGRILSAEQRALAAEAKQIVAG